MRWERAHALVWRDGFFDCGAGIRDWWVRGKVCSLIRLLGGGGFMLVIISSWSVWNEGGID